MAIDLDVDGLLAYADTLVAQAAQANAKRIPYWTVYVLLLRDRSKLKIGFSGKVVERVYRFLPLRENLDDLFDFASSMVFPVSSKIEARALEKLVLTQFQIHRVESPYQNHKSPIPWCACGHTEWLSGHIYSDVMTFMLMSSLPHYGKPVSLKVVIEREVMFNEFLFSNNVSRQ
ncbi:MAG: hypothetical protein PHE17_21230 [Thiothrix sp.]|uniref:hypothetical protein n=1 Tax=Thiothrix sp. TaxID=1032 RepID=UPI0026103019|nr:hypothetical protein [Thiothrix sp.]MDD5395554.1 hypothetical protein [Thiothrix sp.]